MKVVLAFLFTLILMTDPIKIGKINALKKEAKNAFNSGHYKTAIQKYRYLIDSLDVHEDEVMLNLAHAYYLDKDTANASTAYQGLSQSEKAEVRSKSLQQLGIMNSQKGKAEEALADFKKAIKADPSNEDARYNYEMLKKKLDEQKKKEDQQKNQDQKNQDQKKDQQNKDQQNKDQQNKDQQNKKDQEKKENEKKENEKKDQQNKDQQNKDQKDKKDQQNKDQKKEEEQKKKEQEEKEKQQQNQDQKKDDEQKKQPNVDSQKLQQMKISEEKAKMILDAMKHQEVQYLQQNKRKATKPKDKGKPDW